MYKEYNMVRKNVLREYENRLRETPGQELVRGISIDHNFGLTFY
jgi:hypothetical protein